MARHRRGRGFCSGRQANPPGSGGIGRDEASSSGADAGSRNGHNHDDDHSRVGQSQPADQSQAWPPLAEESAALLWEEFEAIGIRVRHAEPVFPPGPGFGATGTPFVGRANRFLGRLDDEGLRQYNMTISPEPTPNGGANREVMSEKNQHTELGGRFPTYHGPDLLFTEGALPLNSMEFEVTLSAGGDKRMDRKYKVEINDATAISLLQLRMLLAGYPTDIPAQPLQLLDTVLRDVVFNEPNDIERVPIGTNDHTLGFEAWKGLYQNIRSTQDVLTLIADVCSTVFVEPQLLIDFVQKIIKRDVVDRNLTEPDSNKLFRCIAGLSVKATDLSSESPSGATKTVIDYFRERYSRELKYKSLLSIDVGCEQNPIYLPIEVFKMVPKQCYQKKLEDSQVYTLRKSASIQPELEQSSHQVVDQNDRKRTKCANEFGKEFDDNLTTVGARVLLPPNLNCHDYVSQKTWFPMNGYWNMKNKNVINGANISNWACVNFCEDLLKKVIEDFCFRRAEMSHITGVGIYGYPIEIQALVFMATRCAQGWLDFGRLNEIYGYKTQGCSHTALTKFSVILESIPDCIFDFMPIHGGYLIGNVGPSRMDLRWFCLGIFIATLLSLATGEQTEATLDIVVQCWQRLIGEMPLKICYPAMENQECHIITGWDPKNTRWSYHNEGSWTKAAWEALKRSIVYFKGKSIGTVAAIDDYQEAELGDAQVEPHKFSSKELLDIVQNMNVSNKVTICLDEDGSDNICLKSFQTGIGAARLWCLKYGLQYDFSHIYGSRVFAFTTPPGGTFYITLKFKRRSITLLLAGRDLYIKGWRNGETHESFEIRMKNSACAPYMAGKVKLVNIKKNYIFLCPDGKVGGTRIGPNALREAFDILFKCKGERSVEVRRAIAIFAVNLPEAIRIQKVYKTVVSSFLNSNQQVLDPIVLDQTVDPEDTNTLWIENYSHYGEQAMLDAQARDSGTNPLGIENRDGAGIQSATKIFREIRVISRDACSKGQEEKKPQKIEDPEDKINSSFIPKPKTKTRRKRRKGKVSALEREGAESINAESVALFLLEDWLLEEDEIDDDETVTEKKRKRKQKGSEGGDSEDDGIVEVETRTGKKRRNGKGSDSEGDGESESEDEIADDKQASKAKEVERVMFSIGKFLERRMQDQIQTMRITEWLSKKLQKTEDFHQISLFNAQKATVEKFTLPKPHYMFQRNAVSLGQRLLYRVSRCLRFL